MELNAFDGQLAVANTHDLTVLGPRRNFENFRATIGLDHQGVIARGLEGSGQALENAATLVMHQRGLPMHDGTGPDDAAPVGDPD